MKKQDSLKPVDLVLAVSLAVSPEATQSTYAELGASLGLSSSTTHESMQRLDRAGLIRPGTHKANVTLLRNFLAHGVRHSFPPVEGKAVRGIPTAHSAPPLNALFDSGVAVVWPDPKGLERGVGLVPLYPKAVELPERNHRVYEALTLIDALRVGQARERNAAIHALDKMMGVADA